MTDPRNLLVTLIERHFARRLTALAGGAPRPRPPGDSSRSGLRDGASVVIVGGGVAGTAFARRLLALTRGGPQVQVTLIDQTYCNYCAGLMTGLAQQALLHLLDLRVPEHVVMTRICECVVVNRRGGIAVPVDVPLFSMLRTDRFGEPGFDDSLKAQVLERMPGEASRFHLHFPAIVTEAVPARPGARARVTFRSGQHVHRVEADVLVVAAGLRSLGRRMMRRFAAAGGYRPPPMMAAGVTEVDTSDAALNRLGERVLIVDGIVPDAVVALIPKRPNWVTVTSLQRPLRAADLDRLFAHPVIQRYIKLPKVPAHLRCRTVCPSWVFTGPSPAFYGDGWLALGDLTGYGRVLKDGYFAAMLGADLAARCLVTHGASRDALARHYHRPLRRLFTWDNAVGMGLFRLNARIGEAAWFERMLTEAARAQSDSRYGGLIHAGLRALFTGELSYRLIGALICAGLLQHYLLRPGDLALCLAEGRGERHDRMPEWEQLRRLPQLSLVEEWQREPKDRTAVAGVGSRGSGVGDVPV